MTTLSATCFGGGVRLVRALIAAVAIALACAQPAALAQATGDFNDDGFADLAIGVPGENINGRVDAGVVHVIYGSANRLHQNGSQIWHLDRPGVPEEVENGDFLGAALAAADFDGDNFDDLAIGIPGRMIGSDDNAGAILVLFGSNDGLSADGARFIHQDTAGILDGAEFNDRFGAALAAGDFDNDGRFDLAIGVPGERSDFGIGAGAVNVLYGGNNGPSSTDDQFFQQGSDNVDGSPEGGDHFGASLAAGDFNGDGNDDLAIGAPDEGDEAGVVHVLYSTGAALTGTGSQVWSQNVVGIPDEAEDDDSFGYALAAGDFDNDGFEDLAIGVPEEDLGAANDAGAVHVIFGAGGGLVTAGNQFWTQDSPGVLDKVQNNDRFGQALAAGFFDAGPFADLAIGAANEAIAGVAQAGGVNVLFGGASGLSSADDEFWHQNVTGVLDQCEFEDRFGTTLAAGDFDNSGHDDLVVGIPFENINASDSGAAAVFYGANGGLRAGPDQLWHQNRPGIADSCEGNDFFGGANAG